MFKLQNFRFGYSESKNLFDSINLEIKDNEITIISGANGTGKTSLLRILSGLRKDYQGSITLAGSNFKQMQANEIAKHIIYQKQESGANIVASTPAEDLGIWLHKYENKSDDMAQIIAALNKFEILNLINTPVWNLSGGQAKRVGLSALLLNYNKFWLLDEPSAGLDIKLQKILLEILEERKKSNLGAIIVSHRLDLFSSIADNIFEIKDKKLQ